MAAVIIFILLIFVAISLFGAGSYKVGNEEKKDVRYVTQESWLTIILPDGTEYEMILLSKSEEF